MHEKDQSQYGLWLRAPNLKLKKKTFSFSTEKKSQSSSSSFGSPNGREVEVEQVITHEKDMSYKAPIDRGKVNTEGGFHRAELRSDDSKGFEMGQS